MKKRLSLYGDPRFYYVIGKYTYALWDSLIFTWGQCDYIMDVVRIEQKRFLFWKWKKVNMIATFRIKQKRNFESYKP